MAISNACGVIVNKREFVAAVVLPLQEHWLPLSSLDLLLPPIHVSLVLCYKKPKSNMKDLDFSSMVGILKSSLAQVLISYYAFAGGGWPTPMGDPSCSATTAAKILLKLMVTWSSPSSTSAISTPVWRGSSSQRRKTKFLLSRYYNFYSFTIRK